MHQDYLPSVPTLGLSTTPFAVLAPSFSLRSILKSQAASKLHPHAIGVGLSLLLLFLLLVLLSSLTLLLIGGFGAAVVAILQLFSLLLLLLLSFGCYFALALACRHGRSYRLRSWARHWP